MLLASGLAPATPQPTFGRSHFTVPSSLMQIKTESTLLTQPTSRKQEIGTASKYVAVHSQIVLTGPSADVPMVARVSMTDYRGNVILDTFVKPSHPVADYRFHVTGICAEHLEKAPAFNAVQKQIAALLDGKTIIGYSLWDFLSVTGIPHPAVDTRDIALFLPFRQSLGCKQLLPLAVLVKRLMGRNIGYSYEHPLENARASLDLYRSCEQSWEDAITSGAWPCLLPPFAYANCFT